MRVAATVDGVPVLSKIPDEVIESLKDTFNFELKRVGTSECCSGGDISHHPTTGLWEFSACTHITNLIPKLENCVRWN